MEHYQLFSLLYILRILNVTVGGMIGSHCFRMGIVFALFLYPHNYHKHHDIVISSKLSTIHNPLTNPIQCNILRNFEGECHLLVSICDSLCF